jgi:catechol 2,3-dioxygenase-like lactoylglutathione lyase family enzyme
VIRQLEHAALSVANLDRSLAFYRDILGFQLVRVIEPRDDAALGTVVGLPGARARIAHLVFGGQMLELFEYVEPQGRPATRTQADLGFSHLGFRTDDAQSDYLALRARGVEFLSEPVEFRPGVWVAYFHGPDGEVCELRQT